MQFVKRTACLVAASVMAATTLAACGSSGKTAGTSSGGSSSASASNAANCGGANLSPLRTKLAGLKQFPTGIGITTPISDPPRNKTVAWFPVSYGLPTKITPALQKAADLLGWTLKSIPTDPTPQAVTASMNTAVQLKPDVAIVPADPPAEYQSQLATMTSQGTKFIGFSMGSDQSPPPGFAYETTTNAEYANLSRIEADQIAIDANCRALHVASFWLTAYTQQVSDIQAFQAELKKYCPACVSDVQSIDPNSIGTTLPSQMVSYLERNPDTQEMVFGYAPMLTGVEQAIKSAGVGTNIKAVLTTSGDETDWKDIANGGLETWDYSLSAADLGYQLFDAGLRALKGLPSQPGGQFGPPGFIVTPDNAKQFEARNFVFIPNSFNLWKKLWGQ